MRNAILFAWNSTLKNLISCYRVEKIETLTSGKKSGTPVVYEDALSKIKLMMDKIPGIEDNYLSLLIRGNKNEIEEHFRFMTTESADMLKSIDGYLNMISKKTLDIVLSTKEVINELVELRKMIVEFMKKFESILK